MRRPIATLAAHCPRALQLRRSCRSCGERAIASENIGRTTLSQGAGALDTASSSNLGGTLEFYSRTPTDDFGLDLQGSFGSENAYRVFGRFDTGDLGGGTKGYISVSHIDAPKWKGQGKQEAWQINSKLVMPISIRSPG